MTATTSGETLGKKDTKLTKKSSETTSEDTSFVEELTDQYENQAFGIIGAAKPK